MSTQTNVSNSAFGAMPYLMLDPAWVEQSQAFLHADARLAKGYLALIVAAWRGAPAGSIPASHAFLAQASGLPLEAVGEHYDILTEAFELRGGRLHHIHMSAMAERLMSKHGAAIEEFTLSTAMAAQAPDLFGVAVVESAKSRTGAKRAMPKGFGYDSNPEIETWAAANGYPEPEDRAWIMERFIEGARSKGFKYVDWAAAFRVWAKKEINDFGRKPPSVAKQFIEASGGTAGRESPFSRLTRGPSTVSRSKGEAAVAHNQAVFAAVAAQSRSRRDARGGLDVQEVF